MLVVNRSACMVRASSRISLSLSFYALSLSSSAMVQPYFCSACLRFHSLLDSLYLATRQSSLFHNRRKRKRSNKNKNKTKTCFNFNFKFALHTIQKQHFIIIYLAIVLCTFCVCEGEFAFSLNIYLFTDSKFIIRLSV